VVARYQEIASGLPLDVAAPAPGAPGGLG